LAFGIHQHDDDGGLGDTDYLLRVNDTDGDDYG
jgi:hypothetical protein